MIDQSTGRKTQGIGNIKRWEDKVDHERIEGTFLYNKNDTNANPLDPQQMNPDSPHPI